LDRERHVPLQHKLGLRSVASSEEGARYGLAAASVTGRKCNDTREPPRLCRSDAKLPSPLAAIIIRVLRKTSSAQ
jgi:hypothetical protein